MEDFLVPSEQAAPDFVEYMDKGKEITGPTSGTLANINAGFDTGIAGLEKAAADAFRAFDNTDYATRLEASADTNLREAEKVKADNAFDGILRSVTEYVPTIAATAATGGVGGAAMMGAQGYGAARNQGADEAEALAYGSASAAANFLIPGAGKAAIGKVGIKNIPKAIPISNMGNRAIAAGEQALAAGVDTAAFQQATTGEIDPMSVMENAALGGVIGGATAGKADTTSTQQAATPSAVATPIGTQKPRTLRGRVEDVFRGTTRDEAALRGAGDELTRRQQLHDEYTQQFPNRPAPPKPDAADIRTSENVSGPLGASREMQNYRNDQAFATARETQKAKEAQEFHEGVVGNKSEAQARKDLSDMLEQKVKSVRGEKDTMYDNITNDEEMVFNNLGIKEGAKQQLSSEVGKQMKDSGYSGFAGIKRSVDEARNMQDLIQVRKRINRLPDNAPPYEVNEIKKKLDDVIESRSSYSDISNPAVKSMVDKAFDTTINNMKQRSDVFSKEFAPFLKGNVSKMSNREIADQLIDSITNPSKTQNKSAILKKLDANEVEQLATLNANTINKKINLGKSGIAAQEIKEEMDNFVSMTSDAIKEIDDTISALRKEGGDIREESAKRLESQKGELTEAQKRLQAISGGYELHASSTAGNLRSIEGSDKSIGEGIVRQVINAAKSLRDMQGLSGIQIANKTDKELQKLIKDAQKANSTVANMPLNTKPTIKNLTKLKENLSEAMFAVKTLSTLPHETESDSKDLPDLSRPSLEKSPENAVQTPEQALPNVRAPGAIVPSAMRVRP